MNYIREYFDEMQSGLQVSKEIYNTYKHLIYKLDNDGKDGFYFDESKANKIIDFAEKFIVMPKSKSKETVKLLLWEKALFQTIFGFVDENGLRQHQEILLEVARKNGKSAIAGIIALYMLICDKERQPECYCVANKYEQAKICWQAGVDMINASEQLKSLCKVRIADVLTAFNGGRFKPLSADKNFDGANSSQIIFDEIHQYQDDELYNVMVDSTAMRTQPLTLLTTTNGFVRGKFLDKKLDEYGKIIRGYKDKNYCDNRRIAFIYKLDSIKEMYDETAWVKANPSIDIVRDREKLRADVERCKSGDEAKKKDVLTKFFNIPQTGQFHYLSVEECNNNEVITDRILSKSKYFIGGFDLSKVNDITSTVALFKVENDEKFYVLNMNFLPSEKLDEHIKTDKIPYDLMLKRGELRLSGTNQIDYKDIVLWFEEIRNKYNIYPFRVGYDAWSASYLVEELKNLYGKNCLVPVRQGAKTLSLPLQHLKAELQSKNINYNNNQLMKTCLLNLKVVEDTNGNLNTIKNRNLNIRDDAACALLDALAVYYQHEQDYLNLI